jgi:hypothetical protein
MAAGNFTLYGAAIERIMAGEIDLNGHTFKAMLATSSYAPVVDTHDDLSDVTNEVSGGGYSQVTITGKTLTRSAGTIVFDADDVNFGSAVTITAKYIVIYDDTHASKALLGYMDLEQNNATGVSSTSSTFQVQWAVTGLFKFERLPA